MTTMTMDRRSLLAAGFTSLLLPQIARAAGAGDYKNLQEMIDKYVADRKISGLSVAIVRGTSPVIYQNGGTIAFDSTSKCTPDTIWRVYSMTKPVTGIAIMRLIEDGKLTLDQPLSSILPEFTTMRVRVQGSATETRPAAGPITIRHLLTHSSGLGYALPGANSPTANAYNANGITPGSRTQGVQPGATLPSAKNLEELCERLAKLPLDFDPGTRWQYAVGIDVLGLVAKKVSGKASFYDYLKTTIFDPLKMHDTDFVVPASKASRLTSVVAEVRTPGLQSARWPLQVTDDRKTSAFLRDRDIHSGGGGLVSTARDYARFCSMLVNNGTLDGARVLKPETLAIARSNLLQNNVRASIGGRNGFGAAMQVIMPDSARPGQEPAGSYGWFGIAGTQMFIDPTNKYSVVAMIQMQPTAVNLQADYKIAAYKDLAAVPA